MILKMYPGQSHNTKNWGNKQTNIIYTTRE